MISHVPTAGDKNRPWSETCKKWGIIISYVITIWAICQQNCNVEENDENMFSGWWNPKDLSGDVDCPWWCCWENCQSSKEVAFLKVLFSQSFVPGIMLTLVLDIIVLLRHITRAIEICLGWRTRRKVESEASLTTQSSSSHPPTELWHQRCSILENQQQKII